MIFMDSHYAQRPMPVKWFPPNAKTMMHTMSRTKTERGPHHESLLAINLRRLVAAQTENGAVNAWVRRFDALGQTTINRICNGTADARIEMLVRIAEATGYEPWQLLHPEFSPDRMPPLHDPQAMRVAAIYASITDPAMKRKALAIMEQFAPDGT
jgi:hypothetical protein